MEKYRQHNRKDTEAGGILVGRILLENDHFIIDKVSQPEPTDKRKRKRFKRKPIGHQDFFDQVWEETDGRCFYLGEWHTHPERVPTPSFIDKKDWRRISKEDYGSGGLFFIIVGTKIMRIWFCDRKHKNIVELKRRSVDE
ncbi:hypothetical protein OBCHQ24_12545 [Oceanobacillus iheyensis]|nr:hypothetical protein OBCHQ24_12545 [Oceanobacillus iheyensis]